MSREIKFRAWEPQSKMMSPVTHIDFITGELDCEHNSGEPKSIEHFELMQFTGLLDKNGKDIYEGDIIEFRTYSTRKGKPLRVSVSIEDGLLLPFYDPCYTEDEQGDWFQGDSPFEVVGNIHENPELL